VRIKESFAFFENQAMLFNSFMDYGLKQYV